MDSHFKKAFLCCFLILIILIPLAVTTVFFGNVTTTKPYVYFLTRDSKQSAEVNMTILGAFTITQMTFPPGGPISGQLDTSCHIDRTRDLSDKIIVINQNNQTCVTTAEQPGFMDQVGQSFAKAVIILDNTPQANWRVSSNYRIIKSVQGDVPVIGIRHSDWKNVEGFFDKSGQTINVLLDGYENIEVGSQLKCSRSSKILVGEPISAKRKMMDICSETNDIPFIVAPHKHLLGNGSISEHLCVKSRCWNLGQKCPQSYFASISQFPVSVECDSIMDEKQLLFMATDTQVMTTHNNSRP